MNDYIYNHEGYGIGRSQENSIRMEDSGIPKKQIIESPWSKQITEFLSTPQRWSRQSTLLISSKRRRQNDHHMLVLLILSLLLACLVAREATLLGTFLVVPLTIEEEVDAATARIPYIEELRRNPNLIRSYKQQRKFFTVKEKVIATILSDPNQRHLYRDDGKKGRLFAMKLNGDYAFRHILKCGGTTVELQKYGSQKGRGRHLPSWGIGNRSLVAVVRDPIDKFLSGWSECGSSNLDFFGLSIEGEELVLLNTTTEQQQHEEYNNDTSSSSLVTATASPKWSYSRRVQHWLQAVQAPRKEIPGGIVNCRPHSYPQANFVLVPNRNFADPRLNMLGDLRELPYVLNDIIGFPFNFTLKSANTGVDDRIKSEWFPKRLDLMSEDVIKDLCRFVALDYYLFDFEPPEVCKTDPTVLPLLHNFSW